MQRVFIPGSEWLYFKIYTGFKSADCILTDYLLPLVDKLKDDELIDEFFFIRYGDPKFHIRFRLHVNDTLNYGIIFKHIADLFRNCIENDMVSTMQCDTYIREIERYGEKYFENVEKIFSYDSYYILRILKLLQESETSENDRWQLALLLVDDMMNGFEYSIEQKLDLIRSMYENYKQEFGFTNSASTKQLNDKYRSNRKIVEITLKNENELLNVFTSELLYRRKNIETIAKDILYPPNFTRNLIYSLIHMTINRLFRSKNRLHELVICNFLQRYYDSEIAKEKKCSKMLPK